MIVAIAIQSINAILFVHLLRIERRVYLFLLAAVLCLYPAFLDYYSFYIDGVTFALGDTCALLGLVAFKSHQSVLRRLSLTTLFFLLAIASYQPKIALVVFLALAALLYRLSLAREVNPANPTLRASISEDTMLMALAVGMATGFYWITAKLLVSSHHYYRTHINSFQESIQQIFYAYTKFYTFYMKGTLGFPHWLHLLPALAIVIGIASILKAIGNNNPRVLPMALVILVLVPIALYASYVINNETWADMGRILSPQGYCLVFFLGCAIRERVFRDAGVIIASVCFYFFMVLSTQESSAIAFKTIYDFSNMNRLATRVEGVLGHFNPVPYALVIVGYFPQFNRAQYIRSPAQGVQAQIFTQSFETYRQIEMLNFTLGQEVFRRPTLKELEAAIHSMRDKMPWPAANAVYLEHNTLVILLEHYHPGIPISWAT